LRKERDADARAHVEGFTPGAVARNERSREHLAIGLQPRFHFDGGRHVVDQNTEVVAAEAGHDFAVVSRTVQAGGDLDEHRVADHVTEGFVDIAEAIEIDHGDRARQTVVDQSRCRRAETRARG